MTLSRRTSAPHVPGEAELWIFIVGDLLVFGLFFAIWSWSRATQPDLFARGGAHVNLMLGLVNTLVLVTSSAAVAAGLTLARQGLGRAAALAYAGAAVSGCIFVGLKAVEYGQHVAAGADAFGNAYFMYYFAFTGIHLLHVVIGVAALLFAMLRCLRLPAHIADRGQLLVLESVGVFWHLVDLLWIVLFFLIYLAR